MFFDVLFLFWPLLVLPMFFSAVLGVGFIFTSWPFFGRRSGDESKN